MLLKSSEVGKTIVGSVCVSVYCTGWGGESWTKTVFFNILYRPSPSCCIEAYIRPEKYSTVLCGLDPWLTIETILTSFFLATA